MCFCRKSDSEDKEGDNNDEDERFDTLDGMGDPGATLSPKEAKMQSTMKMAEEIVEQVTSEGSEETFQVARAEYGDEAADPPSPPAPGIRFNRPNVGGPVRSPRTFTRPQIRSPLAARPLNTIPEHAPILKHVQNPVEANRSPRLNRPLELAAVEGQSPDKPPAILLYGQQPLIEIISMSPPSRKRAQQKIEPITNYEVETPISKTVPRFGDPTHRAAQYAASHGINDHLDEWEEDEWLDIVRHSPDVSVQASSPRGRTVKTGYPSSRSPSRDHSASPVREGYSESPATYTVRDLDLLDDNLLIATHDPQKPHVYKTIPRRSPVEYVPPPAPHYSPQYASPPRSRHYPPPRYPIVYPSPKLPHYGYPSDPYGSIHETPVPVQFDAGLRSSPETFYRHPTSSYSAELRREALANGQTAYHMHEAPIQPASTSQPVHAAPPESKQLAEDPLSRLTAEEKSALNILSKAIKFFSKHKSQMSTPDHSDILLSYKPVSRESARNLIDAKITLSNIFTPPFNL